ncbi:unnamed protein product, partial [Meganyctiphanes norvegica]
IIDISVFKTIQHYSGIISNYTKKNVLGISKSFSILLIISVTLAPVCASGKCLHLKTAVYLLKSFEIMVAVKAIKASLQCGAVQMALVSVKLVHSIAKLPILGTISSSVLGRIVPMK